MSDELRVQLESLAMFSQTHNAIASDLAQLNGTAAPAVGVQTSHGQIASAVTTALGDLLGSRTGAFQTTAETGNGLADRLTDALSAYQRQDEQSAGDITKAGDPMDNPTTAATTSGSGGSDVAGQLSSALGQVGQQVGQLGSALTSPFQAAAQSVQTIPQQVLPGIAGIMQNSAGNDDPHGKVSDPPDDDGQDNKQPGPTPPTTSETPPSQPVPPTPSPDPGTPPVPRDGGNDLLRDNGDHPKRPRAVPLD